VLFYYYFIVWLLGRAAGGWTSTFAGWIYKQVNVLNRCLSLNSHHLMQYLKKKNWKVLLIYSCSGHPRYRWLSSVEQLRWFLAEPLFIHNLQGNGCRHIESKKSSYRKHKIIPVASGDILRSAHMSSLSVVNNNGITSHMTLHNHATETLSSNAVCLLWITGI